MRLERGKIEPTTDTDLVFFLSSLARANTLVIAKSISLPHLEKHVCQGCPFAGRWSMYVFGPSTML